MLQKHVFLGLARPSLKSLVTFNFQMCLFVYPMTGIMGYDNGAIGAVVGVVLVVHVIIGLYIWVAINEEQEGSQDKKQE